MELRQYFAVIRKWLWLIVLGTLLCGSTAYLVSRNMTPIYRASTTLLIHQARSPTATDYSSILTSERLAKTYAERLTKRPVLEEVANRLGLEMEDGKFPAKLEVRPVRDTQLIELSVEHSDPLLAMQIANTLPEVFIERNEAMQLSRFASSKENLAKQLAAIEKDIEATQQTINTLQSSGSADQAELARLQTALTQYQNSYASLLKSYEEIRLAEAQTMDNIIVDEPAELPLHPVKPRTLLNTLLASVVGCMLAVGMAFLIEYLDDTIKSSEDVSQTLGLATLGTITRFHSAEDEGSLIVAAHPRSPISEAYRTLRTNIQFSTLDRPVKTLLVTSANPLEGKSTTVANLGVAMAQAGLSVIVVDSDLRRPSLHKIFGVSNSKGLTNALLQNSPNPDSFLQTTEVENLRVLTSGPLPPNPSELLGSRRMEGLIEQLKEEADVILFDSPPILAVTDAAVLATRVDGVLLVVDAGTLRRDAAMLAKENMTRVGANLLGAALNKLSPRGAGGYYYYYYYSEEGEKRRRRHTGLDEAARRLAGKIKGWVASLPTVGQGA
ncbi:MAG TPA: polysaccharide biosynthesis tyrosine autokinase [Anaerolineae bacterium]|nr:polysaccharide biosynthesis tyrosine autokinase [Anaerolineae bacterium]